MSRQRGEIFMKQIITLLFTLFTFNFSNANEDLKKAMEVMGEQFKVITTALQKQEMTNVELVAAEMLLVSVSDSVQIFPDLATSEELNNQYLELMDKLDQKAQELRDGIELAMTNGNQNIPELIQIFREMNILRQDGHNLFKED